MFYYPSTKALLKPWAQNFKTNIGPIGARINEPVADIAKAQANMDRLLTDMDNAELARLEWERLNNVLKGTMKEVGEETRQFVNRLKGNPLLMVSDAEQLQIISTTAIADLTDYTPDLAVRETGGTIHIGFKKYGADGMNIYGRLQGEAEFKLLANGKRTPYVFTPAALAEGASQVYEFCATPTLANTEVGHRSVIVSFKFSK